jgi:hypothetical protein
VEPQQPYIDYGWEERKKGEFRGDIGAIRQVLTPAFRKQQSSIQKKKKKKEKKKPFSQYIYI